MYRAADGALTLVDMKTLMQARPPHTRLLDPKNLRQVVTNALFFQLMTRMRLKRVALASVTRQGTVTIVQVDLSQCADVTKAAALTPLKGGAAVRTLMNTGTRFTVDARLKIPALDDLGVDMSWRRRRRRAAAALACTSEGTSAAATAATVTSAPGAAPETRITIAAALCESLATPYGRCTARTKHSMLWTLRRRPQPWLMRHMQAPASSLRASAQPLRRRARAFMPEYTSVASSAAVHASAGLKHEHAR